jgi:hypothetical protein
VNRFDGFNADELRAIIAALRAIEADSALPSEESRTVRRLEREATQSLAHRSRMPTA